MSDSKHGEPAASAQGAPQGNQKFSGYRMLVLAGLIYAFVGALGLTCGQLTNSYMVLDPAVTMDRTGLGLGYTAYVVMQGISAPVVGWIISKRGTRFSAMLGAVLTAIMGAVLAVFLGDSTFLYVAGFGIVLSFTCMSAGSIMCFSTISNWFVRKRGVAISLGLTGAAVISVFYPIITRAVCNSPLGWRGGYWMITVFAIVGLVLAFFLRSKPSDMGQEVDGGPAPDADADEGREAAPASKIYKSERQWTVREAVRTPNFWLIGVTAFAVFAAFNLEISQGNLYFVSKGIELDTMATAHSVGSIFGIAATLVTSVVLDRFLEPIRAHALAALLAGVMCLVSALTGASALVAFAYIALTSFGFAVHNASLPSELANMFGNENYSKIHGTLLIFVAILASLIPTIAGAIFDATGSYTPAYYLVFGICVVGFICGMLVRIPKQDAR